MRICFVGDSFVQGTGDPRALGWVGRLATGLPDLTAYNLGIRADTSADIADRWADEVTRRLPPDIPGAVVFSFGVNDACWRDGAVRVPAGETLAHAEAMLTAAGARWPVRMIGPAPIADGDVNGRLARLCPDLGALCRRLDVPYLGVFESLRATPVWLAEIAAGDGAHPGAGGYGVYAELVSAWPAWSSLVARLSAATRV